MRKPFEHFDIDAPSPYIFRHAANAAISEDRRFHLERIAQLDKKHKETLDIIWGYLRDQLPQRDIQYLQTLLETRKDS